MSLMTEDPQVVRGDIATSCSCDGGAGGDAGPGGYADLDSAGLGEAATELATLGSVVHAELLVILAELAARDAAPGGFGDLVEFCVQRFGVLRRTAREWVDVAVALRDLPAISALYATGEIPWDKVRHAVRFATPDTDGVVADELHRFSAQQVAQLAAETRRREPADDQAALDARSLRFHNDHRRGGVRITAWLPFADAEALRHDLAERARRIGPDPITGLWAPEHQRPADALAMLGAAGLAHDTNLDRALTAIHIDHDVLFADPDHPDAPHGNGVTASGGVIPPETARRLCCDGWIQTITETDDGARTVGIGRKSRVVPRWLRRVIRNRDRACRCCGGPIHHIHHIAHWTLGGLTDEANLVGLCWGCHHRVHEAGWTITGRPNAALIFANPYGETVTSLRQPLARNVRRRVTTDTGIRLRDETPTPPNHAPRCTQHNQWTYGAGADPPPPT